MRSNSLKIETARSKPAFNILRTGNSKSVVQNIILICMIAVMTAAPIFEARANGGAMLIQYEFSLKKKPEFRQLNVAYQNISAFSKNQDQYYGRTASPGIHVPLYSIGSQSPGLFNYLLGEGEQSMKSGVDTSDSNDSSKVSAGGVLLLIGLVGLLAHEISQAKKEGCSSGDIGASLLIPYSNLDWCRDNESP